MDLTKLVTEHAPGAFSVYDLAGHYVWVSAGFHDVLGYTADDLVGRNAYEFIHPEDHAAGQAGHQRLFEDEGPVLVRCRLRAADGTYRWVETSSRLVREQGAIVSSSRWVDGKESVIQTLQSERELATRGRDFERQQRHFLTAVSHRARHPVTIISGMTELLRTRADDLSAAQRAQLVERISVNARRLAELVEDVTQAEQLAQRSDRLRVRPVNLHNLLASCLAELADEDAPITTLVPPDLVVFGDQEMLELACTALLENAIEHTPIDTPIWVESRQAHDGTVITVKDAGPGVPPPLRDAIFEPFHRGDPNAPDPGFGLGLHSVAEIAAGHGGRVWVEDRVGGGAAFHLLLPTPAAQVVYEHVSEMADRPTGRTPAAADDPGDAPVAAPPVRVLVVDDDRMVTELLATTLEVDGFDVDVAHDGTEALRRVTESPPDLLICDVRMPDVDGRQVVRTIRSTPAVAELPIILCSAEDDDASQWRSWRSGADSFVAKPFSPDRLVAEVIRVLTQRRSSRASAAGRSQGHTATTDHGV